MPTEILVALVVVALMLLVPFYESSSAYTPTPIPPPPLPPELRTVHRLVLIISASDTAGGYCVPPDATLRTVSPTPCVMIAQAAAQQCASPALWVVDRCINGMRLREWLDGGVLQNGMLPGQPAGSISVPPAAQALPNALGEALAECLRSTGAEQRASTQRPIVVIGLGMVDVLLDAPPLSEHLDRVAQAVALVQACGAVPVLRGYHKIEPSAALSTEALARLATANDALRLWSARNDVDFADVAGETEYLGAADMAPDGVHPTAAYHQRLANTLASALLRVRG